MDTSDAPTSATGQNKNPLYHTENAASGTISASHAERSDAKLTPDPKRKKLFVPYAFGRKTYRSKQASLTASDRKRLSDFAAKAKERWEQIKKSKSNL